MRIKCDYCGGFLEDTDKVCPNCGAPNDHLQRSADGVPKTIEELKAFCETRHLPLKQMRFFIGENYKDPELSGSIRMNKVSLSSIKIKVMVSAPLVTEGRMKLTQ